MMAPPARAVSAPGTWEANPRISIIVPVFNKRTFLEPSIGSLVDASHAYGRAEIILVDNGSSDGSFEFLVETFGTVATITREVGVTIAGVRNKGRSLATGDVLYFVDCDIVVPRDILSRIVSVFSRVDAEAVGCRVGLPVVATWVETTWSRMHRQLLDGYRQWINSGNFAVLRRAFDAVGGFDSNLVTGEDPEICRRLIAAGYKLYETQDLLVAHLDNAKTVLAFFKKEKWRALGMFGTAKHGVLDLPLLSTIAFCICLPAAAGIALFASGPWTVRLALAIGVAFFVPTAAVAYRWRRASLTFGLAKGCALYSVYFLARATALATVLARGRRSETNS